MVTQYGGKTILIIKELQQQELRLSMPIKIKNKSVLILATSILH